MGFVDWNNFPPAPSQEEWDRNGGAYYWAKLRAYERRKEREWAIQAAVLLVGMLGLLFVFVLAVLR